MAKKSKTQRAKASANRRAKKAAAERAQQLAEEAAAKEEQEAATKRKFFRKNKVSASSNVKVPEKPKTHNTAPKQSSKNQSSSSSKKKTKKHRLQFLYDVRAEMRRVTWPTRQDVLQWSGVVIVALLFFGVFCLVLDDWVFSPLLYGLSSVGGLING